MKSLRLSAILLILLSLILSSCGAMTQAEAAQATPTAAAQQPTPARAGDRIVAEGEVVPLQYTFLNFSIQGVISEVLVNEGDEIQPGQVIARLRGSTRLQANIKAAEVEVLAAEQALDKLNKNANVARADVLLRIAQTSKALKDEKEDRDSMAYKRANQSTIETAQAQLILAEDAYKKAQDAFAYFEGKDENDVNRASALTDLAKARQERDRTRANFNFVAGNPDEYEVAIADGELAVAQARYDQALADWELVKNGPNPDDVAIAEKRIENARIQVEAAKSDLVDQELVSPVAGTVITNDLKVGELAGPATKPILIADLSTFQVETTDLTELSVVDIQVGTPVTVSFDAITDLELTGKVLSINALGEDKQGDVTYTVVVALDKQDPRLRWKMTASVVFEIGQ